MLDFDVDEEREATVVVILTNAEGDYKVSIDGGKGSNIINSEIAQGAVRMLTYKVRLQPDHYIVTIESGENAIGEKPQFSISVQ